ncbi:DUF6088 family protein [Myroides sp. LJL116]
MSESISNQIIGKISKSKRGKIFFANDFVKYGTSENIRQILSRLEKEKLIERIAQGIYIKPKQDSLLGTIYPAIEEIANEIAKRDKVRIAPTGVLALYLLGLTTQIPLKTVYLTDGSQREIKVGNRKINFKRTVPKNLMIKDNLLHLVVQAFKEKGQKEITDSFLNTIKLAIDKIDQQVIESQLKFASVWIQNEIKKLYYKQEYMD